MKTFTWVLIIAAFTLAAAWAREAPVKLSLADAVERAIAVDEGYLSAQEDLTAAEASIAEAKSALYPRVTFDAAANQASRSPSSFA